jgi:hypothetical protein
VLMTPLATINANKSQEPSSKTTARYMISMSSAIARKLYAHVLPRIIIAERSSVVIN